MIDYEKLNKFFNENIDEWLEEYRRKSIRLEIHHEKILKLYLEDPGGFKNIMEKIYIKYNSETYHDKWYNLGKEPPMPLAFLIYSFIERYNLSEPIPDDFAPTMFTSGVIVTAGYMLEILSGQGIVIHITKI